MKSVFLACLLALLGACASELVAYDAQFCTWATVDSQGKAQCRAWAISPYRRTIKRL